MKMVKSLLLVSAAGVVAASGAQAADLPVKAKPVEYVKVCSLYGAGFYYIPGTDICMKIGGFVRLQVSTGIGNSISAGPFNGAGGFNNRNTNDDFAWRNRAVATFDTRQQTAYGTLRTYLLMGYNQDSPATNPTTAPAVYMTRGFIQIAGFTFGKATSFFDFVSTAAVAYNAGFLHNPDTGDGGQVVLSYTAQLGNGVSATVGAEQARRKPTVYVSPVFPAVTPYTFAMANPLASNLGGAGASGFAGLPDIVGNIRIDQAWGSAQVMAAAHNVSSSYYGVDNFGGIPAQAGINEGNGHTDAWGYAVGAGLRLNAPMIGPGDYFQASVHYTHGAIQYASNTPSSNTSSYWKGNAFAFGFWEDAVFGGTGNGATPGANAFGNGIHLTNATSAVASYEHFWTPALRTSVYGSWINVTHDASANALICQSISAGTLTGALGPGLGTTAGCNANFSQWNIGSRSQWNVTKDFYVGVDVLYQKLNTATYNNGALFNIGVAGLGAAGTNGKFPAMYQTADQDAVSVTWRVHRDIVP